MTTELERQLLVSLSRLSRQYEREQRRHSEQVGALRKQLDALNESVQSLTDAYRRLARLLNDH